MQKQTSAAIAKIAGKYMNLRPENLYGRDSTDLERICRDVRRMAASLVSQDETPTPRQSRRPKPKE